MPLHCPNCGQETHSDPSRFCNQCGTFLKEVTRPRPDTASLDDEITRPKPDAAGEEDESTRPLSEVAADEEDESTRPLSEVVAGDDFTRSRPEAAQLDNDAMATLISEAGDTDETTRPVAGSGDTDETALQLSLATQSTDELALLTQVDLKIGYVLENRYRMDAILGQGGYGAVYLAEDTKLKRRCVVKQMLVQDKSPKDIDIYRANFKREADLLAELNDPGHPNIPEIYDYFSVKSGNYLVMKYIEGRNLKDELAQSQERMPWREAVRYAIDVCSALDYMHTTGQEPILHRDIKPANILLGEDGRVWLVDFGLAKADPVSGVGGDLANTKASGSLGYTPLEQWFGRPVLASDIYALGATLHHLVTGVSPVRAYNGKFSFKLIKDLHGQFPPVRHIDQNLPKSLEELIGQATSADPERRPTARQLRQQLEALITAEQAAALFTFKNGQSAHTVPELVDLCDENRVEAEAYLYNGDFERWFLLINRNDLAEAASQAVKLGRNRHHGLEKFLRLILPNLFLRRLRKASRHLTLVAAQVILITLAIIISVVMASSYGLRWFLQRTIDNAEWNFYTLDLERENVYTEDYLSETFSAAGYFDEVKVDVTPPAGFKLKGRWRDFPWDVSISSSLQMENKRPHFYITEVNGVPLFFIGENISAGINTGIDAAWQKGPVDLSSLTMTEDKIVFKIEKSTEPSRLSYNPPLSPTPSIPKHIPAGKSIVVVFNQANHDIILKIKGVSAWTIAAHAFQVIEIPAGEYEYSVLHQKTQLVLADGAISWNAGKAYRVYLGSQEDLLD